VFWILSRHCTPSPTRLLLDEVRPRCATADLDAIGRARIVPAKIAARIGQPPTLSGSSPHAFAEMGLVRREVPLGRARKRPSGRSIA